MMLLILAAICAFALWIVTLRHFFDLTSAFLVALSWAILGVALLTTFGNNATDLRASFLWTLVGSCVVLIAADFVVGARVWR